MAWWPRQARAEYDSTEQKAIIQELAKLLAGYEALKGPEARARTISATRRFIRRQDQWFRKDPRVVWLPPGAGALDLATALVRAAAEAG